MPLLLFEELIRFAILIEYNFPRLNRDCICNYAGNFFINTLYTKMHKLISLIDIVHTKIPYHEKINISVSRSSVGWHIEHTLLVAIKISEAINKSNPDDYKWKFNLSRLYVYTLNKIPRGRGKAPKTVQPAGEITFQTLNNNLAIAKSKIEQLYMLDDNCYFIHPYFGKLNLKSTLKFLNIHTQHHLKIIEEILV